MRTWCRRTVASLTGAAGVVAAMVVPASAAPSRMESGTSDNSTKVLAAVLTGAQEAPGPGDPDGRGLFVATVKDDRLCYVLTSRKTEPPMAAHIHMAPRGVPGGIVIGLTPPTKGFSAGCLTAVSDDQNSAMVLTKSELAAIVAHPSAFYVNTHTMSMPAGAIRGQLF
jgi:CHRD domain-containing protein